MFIPRFWGSCDNCGDPIEPEQEARFDGHTLAHGECKTGPACVGCDDIYTRTGGCDCYD